MIIWILTVGVVCFAWGFAAGATHEQYKPITINVSRQFANVTDRKTPDQIARRASGRHK